MIVWICTEHLHIICTSKKIIFLYEIIRNSSANEEHEVEEHPQKGWESSSSTSSKLSLTLLGIHLMWVKCWEDWETSVHNSFSLLITIINNRKVEKTPPVCKCFSQKELTGIYELIFQVHGFSGSVSNETTVFN